MFEDIQREKSVMELFSFGDSMLWLIVTKAYEFIWFGGFQHVFILTPTKTIQWYIFQE